MKLNKIILGIGSNLGRKSENIATSMKMLSNKIDITNVSRVYATDSLLRDSQERYFNLALTGFTCLEPDELLFYAKSIEAAMGRQTVGRWLERIIDIDILDYNNVFFESGQLKIPHGGLSERTFFIYPVLDICPDYVVVGGTASLKDMLDNISDTLNITIMGELKWQ